MKFDFNLARLMAPGSFARRTPRAGLSGSQSGLRSYCTTFAFVEPGAGHLDYSCSVFKVRGLQDKPGDDALMSFKAIKRRSNSDREYRNIPGFSPRLANTEDVAGAPTIQR